MNLKFSEDRPSRADIRADALQQLRAGAEREQRDADARNLELIRTDATLRRLMTAYRCLNAADRTRLAVAAEFLHTVAE